MPSHGILFSSSYAGEDTPMTPYRRRGHHPSKTMLLQTRSKLQEIPPSLESSLPYQTNVTIHPASNRRTFFFTSYVLGVHLVRP
uniref:Uncharacterized protein n=1 Tax=Anguilla anguilla TaxID=7936 RepID=A0A0E9XQ29_ANGAN